MAETRSVLTKLRNQESSLGGWVMSGSAAVGEIFSLCGFDWVCVDAEHTAISHESAEHLLRAIALHGAQPFVRIALNDEIECKKFLDAGARGILVPMVNSAEEVRRAVRLTKYPPKGARSFSLVRATGYGLNAPEYFASANDQILLGIMVEHIRALDELDAMFSVEGVDVVLVGPYDLSGSMGKPGHYEDADVQQALTTIREAAVAHGLVLGIHEPHATPEKIRSYRDRGYRFIGCGIDTVMLMDAGRTLAGSLAK